MHTAGGQANVKVITESSSVERLWSFIGNYNQDLLISDRTYIFIFTFLNRIMRLKNYSLPHHLHHLSKARNLRSHLGVGSTKCQSQRCQVCYNVRQINYF